ncbi:hypothetical protein [Halobacterium wangiae]|uniref:hypothetical protein n=1 Tax=Halobacterium wangiae TaxID=2902623 RepID=UPI001E300A23|nr:hypothetical protein [Halobacterium wangiae]
MDDVPNPYSDDDAWDPDAPSPEESPSTELANIPEFPNAITYYDVLGLERKAECSTEQISQAFKDRLLATEGHGEESRARSKARALLEARDTLKLHKSTYEEMLEHLGPRLGHQTFIQWRIAGMPSDTTAWMREHKPENQTFRDEGYSPDS